MSHPIDPAAQEELESLSEAIASGMEQEQLLTLIAQRTCQVLSVAEAHLFLKQGQLLIRKASHQARQTVPLRSTLALSEGLEGWAARSGRALALEDALADRRFRSLTVAPPDTASEQGHSAVQAAAVPIWSEHQVVGVLSVVAVDQLPSPATLASDFTATPASAPSAREHASIKGLLPLLAVLADLTALALENTRFLAREGRRAKLLTLLHSLAFDVPGKAVLKDVEAQLGEVMEAQLVDVLVYHAATDELVSLAKSETALSLAQRELGLDHLPLGQAGVLAEVFRTGQPFLSNDLRSVPQFPAALTEHLGMKAALVVPLEVEGQQRGLLSVMSSRTDAFFEEDLPFVLLISTRLGHVLHSQELSRELAGAEADWLARADQEQFLPLVAHDLKNILTTLRGNAQLALRRAAREEVSSPEPVFKLIATKADQAIQLVDDLVDASQMESGLFRLFMESVDLVELLQEEVASLQETAGEQHPITFHSEVDQMLVEADRYRLSQVLTNLLTNAIRYSPHGGPIEVTLSQVSAEAGRSNPAGETGEPGQVPQAVLVTINDQGVGILPEERERIFERSFRGRGAQVASGSGLGLYISREIIERHGGRLWVEPREGPGSSFRFTLPTSRTSPHELA